MIDVVTNARCKACNKPVVRVPGRRPREYCNDACRQKHYRQHHQVEQEQTTLNQQNIAALQEKLTATAGYIAKLERQVEVQRSRIGELTAENRTLKAQFEAIQLANERFRTDTQVRAFPAWLEKQAQYYAELPFGQRFLAERKERLLPPSASRSTYERIMRYTLKYSEDEIEMFREAWREMFKTQF